MRMAEQTMSRNATVLFVEKPAWWDAGSDGLMTLVGRAAGITRMRQRERTCLILGYPVVCVEGRYHRRPVVIDGEISPINVRREYAVSIGFVHRQPDDETLLMELRDALAQKGLAGFLWPDA